MIPILYTADETEFTCNGVGRLTDCISCEVTEERNGVYEVEFVYPVNGIHYEDITLGMILYTTHDASKKPQPFVIYKRSAEIDGHVTFNAHHISYRMSGIVVKPISLTGTATEVMEAMKTNALGTCPFTFWSDRTGSLAYGSDKPATMREMLGGEEGSVLELFGGEFEFDNFAVKLWVNRGTDHGVSIRYGKNMTDITAESNEEGAYNAVVPFWSNGEELVTLPEWYVTGPGAQYGIVLAPLDLSDVWDSAPTALDLRTEAQRRLSDSQAWLAQENIEVEFAQLWQTEEYADVEALQRVVLCDTVSVYYTAAGVEAKTKVIKTVYDPLAEQYTSIELGAKLSSLADTISQRTEDSILQKTVTKGFMAASIENATQLITGGRGGYVVLGQSSSGYPDEILIMDTDSTQTAVHVIRMNRNGIGFSTSGYQGPFVSAWTIDGVFNTAFINVASLSVLSANAGIITAGVLRSEDYSYTSGTYSNVGIIIDLDNKVIRSTKYAFLPDGSLNASDAHLMGSLVTRDSAGTEATAVSGGAVRFYLTEQGQDIQTAAITSVAYGETYTGSGNRGMVMRVNSGADYISLGYTSGNTNYTAVIINKSLNPVGYTERVIIMDTLRATASAVFNTYIFCGSSVNACKNVMTGVTADRTANRIGLYCDPLTAVGYLFYQSDASGSSIAKNVIIVDPNGDVVYAGGSVSGDLAITGTLNVGTFDSNGISTRSVEIGNYFTAIAYDGGTSLQGARISSGSLYMGNVLAAYSYLMVLNGTYGLYASGTISAQTVTQRSDERLKDITTYDERYDRLIDMLEPISYSWKADEQNTQHVGLGARRTSSLLTELGIDNSGFVMVDSVGDQEVYSINYMELSVMLLYAVQRLREKVAILERKVAG